MKKTIIATLLILCFSTNAFAQTTVDFYSPADEDDGCCTRSDSTYPPGTANQGSNTGGYLKLYKQNDGSTYYVSCILLRFDTSTLPDNATITSATLYLRVYTATALNTGGRNADGEYYSFTSISNSDYSASVGTTAFSISSGNLYPDETISLSNLSNISKTGYTGFRIGISGGAPSAYNGVHYDIYGQSQSYPPKLTVTYVTGYSKKINGVTSAAKVNGVSIPAKVNGL